MAVARDPDTYGVFDAHRLKMIDLMRQIDKSAGIPEQPDVTAPELRDRMVASGIRPEENLFSNEILFMRYGEEISE